MRVRNIISVQQVVQERLELSASTRDPLEGTGRETEGIFVIVTLENVCHT